MFKGLQCDGIDGEWGDVVLKLQNFSYTECQTSGMTQQFRPQPCSLLACLGKQQVVAPATDRVPDF